MNNCSEKFFETVCREGYRPCESCDLTRSNCLIYIKSGYGKEIGKKLGKSSTKSGKIRTFTC